jgi:mono/diheme cytochrome c family protein
MLRNWLIALVIAIIVIGAVAVAVIYRPAIDPLPAGQAPHFDTAMIAHGAELAAIGDCGSCHTASGGKPFAGGVAVPTPFGTIYSSNITPDEKTGIGRWSEAAFERAMQQGVARDGHLLYPAFPYDHFTHVTADDDKALYAFLMTRDPAESRTPANKLGFPFNVRAILAGWNLLFLHPGPIAEDSSQSAEWNRGRYLAEGLGHCAACHTPHNGFGAEDASQAYAGGSVIDGWYVYPIDDKSAAPVKWDAASLASYLKSGFAADHGAAAGPMAQVTAALGEASDADVTALATYVASKMQNASGKAPPAAAPSPPLTSGDSLAVPQLVKASADQGETIFATACSSCHTSGRPLPYGGVDFHLSTAISADSPQNAINMILFGLPAGATHGPIMPGFAGVLNHDQVVAVLGYLRKNFTGKPAWSDADKLVADTLSGATAVKTYSADGVERMPGAGDRRILP